ncbi:MAG: hypothetical protein EZS28_006944 [Streblomastix strix]|uniref:Uncharacterized protein n=1 Tax=Streblomastix strix TaxID=222440 RepID=A0A5J4WRV1_9EUKA|nr:MAG: hypothetical protein EZS28_006944 [Streblomastix strix]
MLRVNLEALIELSKLISEQLKYRNNNKSIDEQIEAQGGYEQIDSLMGYYPLKQTQNIIYNRYRNPVKAVVHRQHVQEFDPDFFNYDSDGSEGDIQSDDDLDDEDGFDDDDSDQYGDDD